MVVKIRLARFGKRNAPFYNVVVAQARSARNSKPLEVLGTYDPIPKEPLGGEDGASKYKDIRIDVSRAKYWLGVGAQPSDPMWRLLAMIGLLEPRHAAKDKLRQSTGSSTPSPSSSNQDIQAQTSQTHSAPDR